MSVAAPVVPELRVPTAVEEALADLADLGPEAVPLAGGTWVMRSDRPGRRPHVALGAVAELRRPSQDGAASGTVLIGAMATHADLARTAPAHPALDGLRTAAETSAFPQIRNVATVGGNLCATGFAQADLVPALLAADASARVATVNGRETRPVAELLASGVRPGEIVLGVEVPAPAERRSGFARLTVRGAGEYAIANVAVSLDLDARGVVTAARAAVGAVEPAARICPDAAAALVGRVADPDAAEDAGRAAATECTARDGRDAPGWYRLAVLPALFRSALGRINQV